jgi:hypothetical protein
MVIDEGSALMVGDFDGSSVLASVQFIEFRDERQIITSPDDTLTLEKVDPVTLFGFAPAPIAYDKKEPRPGKNVTVVGYGSNSSWDWNGDTEYPGVAMKAPLQVLEIEYCTEALAISGISEGREFCAGGSDADPPFSFLAAGPCYGTRDVPSRSLSSDLGIGRSCGPHADPILYFDNCFEQVISARQRWMMKEILWDW